MIYANKKVQQHTNNAAHTSKIIENVIALEEKNLVRISGNDVFLHPELWKDRLTALNWIKCLHVYCTLKKRFKDNDPLYFRHLETEEIIGTYIKKKASLSISF